MIAYVDYNVLTFKQLWSTSTELFFHKRFKLNLIRVLIHNIEKGGIFMSMTYQNILVAVDGSNESMLAFKRAIQVAINNVNSKLYVVHVIDTRSFAFYESYNLNMADKASNHATEMLNAHISMAKDAGVENVEMVIEYGAPRQIIARDLPKVKKIDLIVCGVTGKGEVERLLLGSVSEAIVRSAKCDVLVVRN